MLVVSDSHLSERAAEAGANWMAVTALAEHVELVIHAGDLTLDGARNPADLKYARRMLDGLPVPWVAIPGNHDVGDNPGSSEGPAVDADRRHPSSGRRGVDVQGLKHRTRRPSRLSADGMTRNNGSTRESADTRRPNPR